MKLYFIGADHEVTGSLHLVQACGLNIAVDVGMEQGSNPYENAPMPIKFSDLDYVLLTHAHIDHAGMLPYAYKNGFCGTVLCTKATEALSDIMLRDSAHIQVSEAAYKNRKGRRSGAPLALPVYDLKDADGVLSLFQGVDYQEVIKLADGVHVRFVDAGHLLGSASVELYLEENGVSKKLVFSGDIGNFNKPLIRDPQYLERADYVIMESTYGDRLHETGLDHVADLQQIVQRTLDRGGNVVIPAFAVGRTQELLYLIRRLKTEGLIHGHDGFPVYVDSPLAVEATQIFQSRLKECYDAETRALVERGINPLSFRGLKLSITAEESKAINFDDTPKVIISASGMCDAGRIRHHLKHNLWREECTVVFAGYQAEGTLGRVLVDGAESVRLFGEEIEVRAEIATMAAMSSHADQEGLLQWIAAFREGPERVFLVHGDDGSMETLSGQITERTAHTVDCPYSGSVFDLAAGKWIYRAEPRPTEARTEAVFAQPDAATLRTNARNAASYERLCAAYGKLLSAVRANQGGTNKDLAKFADQILNLYDKWMR